jgi:hypothetical protein
MYSHKYSYFFVSLKLKCINKRLRNLPENMYVSQVG